MEILIHSYSTSSVEGLTLKKRAHGMRGRKSRRKVEFN